MSYEQVAWVAVAALFVVLLIYIFDDRLHR